MKKLFAIFVLTILSHSAFAGFPPLVKCSNLGATIEIAEGHLKVLVTKDLEVESELIQKMPEQRRGTTSRAISFKEISFVKRDGTPMPHAYNRLAEEDGSLNDYFICSFSQSWLARGPFGG
jgi:hypothetical protein